MRLAYLTTNSKYHPFAICLIWLCCALNACSLQSYTPKPIKPAQQPQSIITPDLADPDLKVFVALHGETLPQSNEAWNLNTLVATALFFHPDLTVAREQYKAAQLESVLGKQKPLPSISTQIAQSNRANGDIDPFAMSLGIAIPIQTNGKQAIRIARLDHLSEIAKLDIAQTAWDIRQAVLQAALAIHQKAQQLDALQDLLDNKKAIAKLITKRVQYGEASSLALHQAQTDVLNSEQALQKVAQSLMPLRAQLAKAMRMPISAVAELKLDTTTFDQALKQNLTELTDQNTQTSALVNRIDIRKALLNYAVVEQSLKLEYAKQIPDIVLSPGYAFEFGDHVWSLGFDSLFNLLNKNKVGIARAKQLREVEVAKFTALQSSVIADAQVAHAKLSALLAQQETAATILQQAKAQLRRTQKQFDAGLLDRVALTLAQRNVLNAQQSQLNQIAAIQQAMLALESTIQHPILTKIDPFSVISSEPMPPVMTNENAS